MNEVLVHGCGRRPRETALRASSPAATSSLGLDVLVQLVIAASTTAPSGSASPVVAGMADAVFLKLTGSSARLTFS
ncbi:hypothetical protein D9M69_633340 [compost metagenome]